MHLREGGEIVVDKLARLTVRYLHPLSQSVSRYAIDNSEVGLLGLLTLCVGDVIHCLVPYLCGSGAVYVEAFAERLYHILVAGEMRHDPEFYLAVVG